MESGLKPEETQLYQRLIQLDTQYSFFLFGARGVGKSTLLQTRFSDRDFIWIDLLDAEQEAHFAKNPNALKQIVEARVAQSKEKTVIVIDEIQKQPKLLDSVHSLIEKYQQIFILTGSSARKLKAGAANLLAGRAFVFHLFPLSFLEMGDQFDLKTALQFGSLPQTTQLTNPVTKKKYLEAYAHTYLKEEVVSEQLVKDLNPFRRFLEVAGQMNGKVINTHRIAQDVGVDDKTVTNYFSILEDTLLGFYLEPFHHSFRKRLSKQSKFFFIDLGIARSLARLLSLEISPQTSYYGELFEQFIIVEIYKLCRYFYPDYRLSFIRTKDDAEVDLVVDRPGKPLLLIEIKSAQQIDEAMLRTLKNIHADLENSEAICLSQDPYEKIIDGIKIYPWQTGIKTYFAEGAI